VSASDKPKRKYVDTKTRYEGVFARHSLNCNLAVGMKRCNCEPTFHGTVWDSEIGRNRRTGMVDDIQEARNRRTDLLAEVRSRRGRRGSRRPPLTVESAANGGYQRVRLKDLHPQFIEACEEGIALNKHGRAFTKKARTDLESSLRHLPDWLRCMYVDEIGDHHFQRAVDEFRAGDKPLSSSRIKNRINAVRSLSRWAVKRRKIPTPLAVEVEMPAITRVPRKRPPATPGEFLNLLDQLEPEDALPWALAAYATARSQEIEHLDWPEVDFDNDVLLLAEDDEAKKSEAARRIVPMVRQLRDRLYAEWLRQGNPKTGRVCPPRRADNKSGRLSLNALQKRRFPVWEDLDLEPIGLQDSRHTAATWLDHAGVSPKVASVFMGHKAPKRQPDAAPITLGRYTHVLPGELQRARDQFQRFLDAREHEEAGKSFAVDSAA